MGNHTTVKGKTRDQEFTLSQTASDAPILPIPQLKELAEIGQDKVEWVFTETKTEADYRRSETHRLNTLVFIERIAGQVFGLLIGLAGLASATYCAVNGAAATGAVIGGTTVVALVSAFLLRNRTASRASVQKQIPGKKR